MRDLDKEKIEYCWGNLPVCSRVRLSMLAALIAWLNGGNMRRAVVLAIVGIGVLFAFYMMRRTPEMGLISGVGIGIIIAGLFLAWLFQGYFDK